MRKVRFTIPKERVSNSVALRDLISSLWGIQLHSSATDFYFTVTPEQFAQFIIERNLRIQEKTTRYTNRSGLQNVIKELRPMFIVDEPGVLRCSCEDNDICVNTRKPSNGQGCFIYAKTNTHKLPANVNHYDLTA